MTYLKQIIESSKLEHIMNLSMKIISLAALTLSSLLAGCMGGGWGGGFSMPPTLVEIATAEMQPVENRFQTVGTIEADDAVTIVSEIGGIVVQVPFNEGGRIGRGDLIARLDDTELKAELDRAAALREQAQATYNRIKAVVESKAGAQQDLDDAAAALKVAEANEAYAQARFDKTRITAPFSGIVGARKVSRGAYVRPGDAITELARIEELRVKFSVPERHLAALKQGASVEVSTTAYPGSVLTGTIDIIEPQIDPGTRSIGIVARVSNPEGLYRPGLSADVAVAISERQPALTISSEAIFLDQNQPFVYIMNADSTVKRSALRLGTRTTEYVEVASGLEAGQQVVRAGHQKIFEGAKVIPVPDIEEAEKMQAATADSSGAMQ